MSDQNGSDGARFHGRPIRLVLFDLDGTLADTAPDLAYALNQTLLRHGREALPFEQIRPHVSHGGIALIRAGFGIEPGHPEFQRYRDDMLAIYQDNIARHTALFPGMEQVLIQLEHHAIGWGVVTNKPAWLTDPLMDSMELTRRAACIVSGDTTPNSKPHPGPILYACQEAGIPPQECLYIGDAERDISAGRAAGTCTLTALFGYLNSTDQPEAWGADDNIALPIQILEKLGLK
ncbi:HAD family hydrolase [Sedimenticola thiotaurini]|uniref:Phosphoglycolate phosphatase n=1 Tax=Sedimenticola thiotaurini TaxID=1543721 RepID=A0A0F7JVZ0_9GAMM|nr:HAD-IA family hydrolase [Sedimenticola thiotaurini]AKH19762.1 phosphoglycolate phosphatase [Sedimenticola thiotaurini]